MKMKDFDLSNFMDENAEFIPLLSSEDEERFNNATLPDTLPILPLRNTVLFPGVVIPITVGRDKSIKLIQDAYENKGERLIGVVAQKDPSIENPAFEHLYKTGTLAHIIKLLKMPDGSTTIIIQGQKRFELLEAVQEEPYLIAKVKPLETVKSISSVKFDALISSIKDVALEIIKKSPNLPSEASIAIKNIESPSFLINFISSNMNATIEEKQQLLESGDIQEKAQKLLEHLTKELQMLELKNDLQSKVKHDIDRQQREYFLHQQMKLIQEELGGNPVEEEINEFRKRAETKKWPEKVKQTFEKELAKLERMNPAAAEYGVQSNYIETLLDLPWNEYSQDIFDLKRAKKILDRDHYGLEEVKDRILEFLAVLKLKNDMKSPILCLYGPPGVGKTSLGKSIAEALGRKYVRMSLGGLRDEAEIRGHRKTYIGAMPGRIIQNLRKAQTSNPVFVLDEIDKIAPDGHGDPSSALLEVLDPEQNTAFHDNFIELDYDLSKVLFIATANSLSTIQPALRDRMEIIEVSGYTLEEKIEIAKRHLIPKLLEEHGLKKGDVQFSKAIITKIIEEYTFESGVRTLNKKLASVIRKIAKKIAMEEPYNKKITVGDLQKYLGAGTEKEKYSDIVIPGVVTGLAWTPAGGDILFVETSLSKGNGKLNLTGNLGDVMKESAVIALEFIKAHQKELGIKDEILEKHNIHIHVPAGATPKDGPSAGITILTALTSLLTGKKVKSKMAMTGEITLRGKVLPVGGIKEKILAAKRAGIKEVVLPQANEKDVKEIKEEYLKGLTFHYVENMMDVINLAITNKKISNPMLN
ncbi:MAG: endopeptidase La [Bacteroidetes bacterium]|nr:MAG: endopeptidase La [Bacteroidota bacterium]